MAKGQKRSNRETKKPKQVKAPAAVQSALTTRLTESKDRPAKAKK